MSGLSRTPGKRVWDNIPPRVRIPPSPPEQHLKQSKDVHETRTVNSFAGFLLSIRVQYHLLQSANNWGYIFDQIPPA